MRIITILCLSFAALLATASGADPLQVVATVPDLGAFASEIGGEEVEVTVLVKGPQDAHFAEPRPSYIRKLHDADLLIAVGMDLEVGWLPVLLQGARNPGIVPGSRGYLAAAAAIRPLEVPTGTVNRSMGDVHLYGNPHFLVDPVAGLRVAALVRDKLVELRPGAAAGFQQRYDAFALRLAQHLVGPELASRHTPGELADAVESGGIDELARSEGVAPGGWLLEARALQGVPVVEDHRFWTYFAERFGLRVVGTLEPKPGIAPTSGHLAEVVQAANTEHARAILATPYFDPRHARWVSERTGAKVAEMAHQVGSREGTQDYLAMVDYNLRQVLKAVQGSAPS